MKLLTEWEKFQEDVGRFVQEGNEILQNVRLSQDVEALTEIEKVSEQWKQRSQTFFEQSFDENSLAMELRSLKVNRYSIVQNRGDIHDFKNGLRTSIHQRVQWLQYNMKILQMSDAIVRPEEIDLEERRQLDTEQILELILDKLYDLYDEQYYPILDLLNGNGVELKRRGEDQDLVKYLESLDYVDAQYLKSGAIAQLNTNGKLYVEQKRKKHTPDYSRIDNSVDELNAKLEEILDYVQSQGEMQQAIAEELNDLKLLFGSLNKKNLGQLLKGKLVDLMFGQVINPKTANFIFETFTQDILKLK